MLAARPLFGGLVVSVTLGLAALAAIPRLGSQQPQTLTQQTQPPGVKSADGHSRRTIVDTRVAPYAAVGKFSGTVACTAAIVLDPRIIITASHCITERDGSIRKSNLSFRLGYQAGNDRGRFEATVATVGSKQSFKGQSVHAASQDWAILILDRAAHGVEPFLVSHDSVATLRLRQQQVLMPAYSDDAGNADVLSLDPECSIGDLVWGVLVHDCKARYGSSGAPLLMRDGPRYAVIGIHTGSMFASDQDGHIAKFVGYRAIGTWAFADALRVVARQLAGESLQAGESPTH